MPLTLALLLPLLAQAGPSVSGGAGGALPHAPLEIHHPARTVPSAPPAPPSRQAQCFALARTDPLAAIDTSETWLRATVGSERTTPNECLGLALTGLGRWDDAEQAFLDAREAAAASDRGLKARYGAMAGNAALAAGGAERGLAELDAAHGEALGAGDMVLAGDISVDRARALVALKRPADAAAALAEARTNSPANPQGWLLSATLSRREGKLADAQSQIERAAALLPVDPEIGLEAGVIAVLAGHDDAARKSWQSVIAAAPGSDTAKQAQAYLDQLGPAPAPSTK